MEQDLEKRTYRMHLKYNRIPCKRNFDEIDLPAQKLKYAILLSGIGTIITGAALAYTMFPKTIEQIIRYFN